MKANQFVQNNEADVLGLPMYLIIVMIVAVAVIAAVIYMIPKGKQMMAGSIIGIQPSNGLSKGTVQASTNRFIFDPITFTVMVQTLDSERDPIQGASVSITGCHGSGVGTTSADGTATVTFAGAFLEPGINEGYLKITVNAPGYETFTQEQVVTLIRGA